MKPVFFDSQAEFHRWLEQHHNTASELLVGFYKKQSARGAITYKEALDEALCFGWIDGVRKGIDAVSYTIRFTPRKPRSIWSLVNTSRARQLSRLGLMKPPGLRAFRARNEKKTRQYSYERHRSVFDPALDAKLRANKRASAFFQSQPPGYQKIVTFWVMSAKRQETRERRLALLIERSATGARLDFMKPNAKR
jgi:uncharacterized protein YdeI (YjbR/CyaY-like superfamily)